MEINTPKPVGCIKKAVLKRGYRWWVTPLNIVLKIKGTIVMMYLRHQKRKNNSKSKLAEGKVWRTQQM